MRGRVGGEGERRETKREGETGKGGWEVRVNE